MGLGLDRGVLGLVRGTVKVRVRVPLSSGHREPVETIL